MSSDNRDIVRIDSYDDTRFSQMVLNQHGAYLIDGEPYEVEIIDNITAIVMGKVCSIGCRFRGTV
jgi:hypothetical protein